MYVGWHYRKFVICEKQANVINTYAIYAKEGLWKQ